MKIMITLLSLFGLPLAVNARSVQSDRIKEIEDLLMTVKSTEKNYNTRINLMLDTWHPEALKKVKH